jgi:hypothetical protein
MLSSHHPSQYSCDPSAQFSSKLRAPSSSEPPRHFTSKIVPFISSLLAFPSSRLPYFWFLLHFSPPPFCSLFRNRPIPYPFLPKIHSSISFDRSPQPMPHSCRHLTIPASHHQSSSLLLPRQPHPVPLTSLWPPLSAAPLLLFTTFYTAYYHFSICCFFQLPNHTSTSLPFRTAPHSQPTPAQERKTFSGPNPHPSSTLKTNMPHFHSCIQPSSQLTNQPTPICEFSTISNSTLYVPPNSTISDSVQSHFSVYDSSWIPEYLSTSLPFSPSTTPTANTSPKHFTNAKLLVKFIHTLFRRQPIFIVLHCCHLLPIPIHSPTRLFDASSPPPSSFFTCLTSDSLFFSTNPTGAYTTSYHLPTNPLLAKRRIFAMLLLPRHYFLDPPSFPPPNLLQVPTPCIPGYFCHSSSCTTLHQSNTAPLPHRTSFLFLTAPHSSSSLRLPNPHYRTPCLHLYRTLPFPLLPPE